MDLKTKFMSKKILLSLAGNGLLFCWRAAYLSMDRRDLEYGRSTRPPGISLRLCMIPFLTKTEFSMTSPAGREFCWQT